MLSWQIRFIVSQLGKCSVYQESVEEEGELGKKLANFPPVKITLKPPPHNFEVTNMPSKNTVAKVNLMSLCCHGKSKKMHPSLANVQVDMIDT